MILMAILSHYCWSIAQIYKSFIYKKTTWLRWGHKHFSIWST